MISSSNPGTHFTEVRPVELITHIVEGLAVGMDCFMHDRFKKGEMAWSEDGWGTESNSTSKVPNC
jgi:hypothetical protein